MRGREREGLSHVPVGSRRGLGSGRTIPCLRGISDGAARSNRKRVGVVKGESGAGESRSAERECAHKSKKCPFHGVALSLLADHPPNKR
jgi:hypothetical protein